MTRPRLSGLINGTTSLYRLRHLVENAFVHLKHFRAIATRYDKLARNYKVMFATGMHLYLV